MRAASDTMPAVVCRVCIRLRAARQRRDDGHPHAGSRHRGAWWSVQRLPLAIGHDDISLPSDVLRMAAMCPGSPQPEGTCDRL